MKKIMQLLLLLIPACIALSQNVGIGTSTPHNSAQLDITSTTKGMLAPRMTTVQRNAIATPAKGLLVYDTDLNNLYHYNGNAWAAVGGSGGLTLPYAATPGLAGVAFKIDNTGTAIQGTSTALSGYGIYGVNNVSGGFGVVGQSVSGTAVYGNSAGAGTALRGVSSSGYALNTTGNVRISGGNTNPSAGAILTSVDASGNAVWKANPRVAFRAVGVYQGLNMIPDNFFRQLHCSTEQYDYANSFTTTTSNTPTSDMSKFTAPVAGLYHFDAGITLSLANINHDFSRFDVSIKFIRSGNIYAVAKSEIACCEPQGFEVFTQVSTDVRLQAGDDVYVELIQNNSAGIGATISNVTGETYFSGRLVFAD